MSRFAEAVAFFIDLHAGQVRKGNGGPYDAHLLAVTAMVRENGGDEDTCIAAMGHDAVEDRGGMDTANLIEQKFGSNVVSMILECSDTVNSNDKEPWRQRKEKYLASFPQKSKGAILITLGDKTHNLRCTLQDLEWYGADVLEMFRGKGEGVKWYYSSVYDALRDIFWNDCDRVPVKMLSEYHRLLIKFRDVYKAYSKEAS